MGFRRLAAPFLLAVIGTAACLYAGSQMKQNATQSWRSDAESTVGRITETTMFWVSVLERDLRGIATLYYASSDVSEDELLDAVDNLASGTSPIPLISVAYLEANDDQVPLVVSSTDLDGILSPGSSLSGIPGMQEAFETASLQPERVQYSRPFGADGESRQVLLVVSVPSDQKTAFVVTRLNLSEIIQGVRALLVPEGIGLRFLESWQEGEAREVIGLSSAAETSSFVVLTKTDNLRTIWWFEWHVSDAFAGGPSTSLSLAVAGGGTVLSLLIAAIFASLLLQNARINRRVEERTTELEEARASANQTRDLLVNAIESIDSAFAMYDSDDRLVVVNQRYKQLNADFAESLVPGTHRETVLREMYRVRGGDAPEQDWIDQRMQDFRQHQTGDLRQLGDRWGLISNFGTSDGGTVVLISDVTELQTARETAEAARRSAEKAAHEAQAASDSKTSFLANISHEIRTPLNAIMGFAEILDRRITDPQMKEYAGSIVTSGKSLVELINDILAFSKLESDEPGKALTLVEIPVLLGDLVEAHRPLAEAKGLDFRLSFDPGLPFSLKLDDSGIRKVLRNVIGNAIKFTKAGSITMSARSVPGNAPRTVNLTIDVKDSGIGIPEDQLESIFDVFSQRHGQSINEFGGTGLGLALVRRLLTSMNGDISVTSEIDVGSTFRITLHDVPVENPTTLGELQSEAERVLANEIHPEPAEADKRQALPPDVVARLPGLLDQLENRADHCAGLADTMTMNDIDDFAEEVSALATDFAYPAADDWGRKLARASQAFDLDLVLRILAAYPEMVADVRLALEETKA